MLVANPSVGDPIRRAATVTGRVQGISFRYATRREATRLGVTGWVRNTAAGSVELEVQGNVAAVEALLRWAETGPVGARVDRVAVVPRPLDEQEADFRVLR
jgi:acylphosphatase